MPSGQFQLNSLDWKSIAKHAGIVMLGALLTYVSEVVAKTNFGDYAALATALWSVILHAGLRFIQDNGN